MAQFDLTITLEYDIITASDSDTIVIKTNERIQTSEGWQPLGGPIAYKGVLCQAVVREKPKEEPVYLEEVREAIRRNNRFMGW